MTERSQYIKGATKEEDSPVLKEMKAIIARDKSCRFCKDSGCIEGRRLCSGAVP